MRRLFIKYNLYASGALQEEKMDVTIKDVAKEAKVAASTVSRVIKDSPNISEETKRRVREVMDRLGYYPNFQAQSLAGKNTKAIGVILPNAAFHSFQNPFFSEVLLGISTSANKHKYGIYLSTSATEDGIYEEVVRMVQGKRVDGILLLYSRKNDKLLTYLNTVKIPFTVVGRPYEKEQQTTYVDNDNIQTSIDVTNFLINAGHRRMAFIGGNQQFVVTADRLKGYKKALENEGIAYDEKFVINEQSVKEEGRVIIEKLVSLEEPPTAIITQDDLIAFQIISHLESLNLNVPNDISIISFNNYFVSEHSRPPLTSVDIGINQLGFEATDALIELIEEPSTLPKRITIPAKLIERESVRILADFVKS